MQVIASYQVSAFTVPANATPNDADQVRGNDNTLRAALNSHDGDSGIHFQSSTLAARPAAGILGQKWLTTDDGRIYYDDGSNWQEIAYTSAAAAALLAPKANPTFTGTITGVTLALSSNTTATITLTGTSVAGIQATGATAPLTLASQHNHLYLGASALDGASDINLQTLSVTRWSVKNAGHLVANAGNAYDIGTIAVPVRNVYCRKVAGETGLQLILNTNGSDRWQVTSAGDFLPVSDNVLLIGSAAARVAEVNASFYKSGAAQVLQGRLSGWTTDPTGTLTRTTFISDSVTLVELAKRVAALIVDLRIHGMIGT